MADDPPIEPAPEIVPPPVEAWTVVDYDRYNIAWYPSGMHPLILSASSDWDIWNSYPDRKVALLAEIVTAAVLDFREAYGAAFEAEARDDTTLVPTSCLPYIDATVFYNVSLRFGLYALKPDGVTKEYLTDYFFSTWKDASVYRRHIAEMRKRYREEIAASLAAEGTPVYIPRTERSARSL